MNKKDFDLKLWSYIQSESTFPKITEDDLDNEYIYKKQFSFGAESKIYLDKSEDYQYIYKLTNPYYKSLYNRFNGVLMYYILQDYLFNDFKYENLKICGDKIFVRQKFTESQTPSDEQIRSCMDNAGYKFNKENRSWVIKIRDIIIITSDLNSDNCSINKNKLEVFDSIIEIDYDEKYSKFF